MNTQTNYQYVRLKLIDDSQINGMVNLNRAPGFERISDLILSREEPFLVISQASVYGNDLETLGKKEVLCINKNHILWAEPCEKP